MLPRFCFPGLLLAAVLAVYPYSPVHGEPLDEPISPKTIRTLQIETANEPFQTVPVILQGVVTWVDETAGKKFYLQDQTSGILITFEGDLWPKFKESVEVTGQLTRGPYSAVVAHAKFRALGAGALPPATTVPGWRLLNGVFNGELVAVNGWVRSTERVSPSTLNLLLYAGPDHFLVRVSHAENLKPDDLIAANVQVCGVASPTKARGAIRQLVDGQVLAAMTLSKDIPPFIRQLVDVQVLVASPEDLHVNYREETINPWLGPITPLNEAFHYHPGQTRGERIRVRGMVVKQKDGVTYLSDDQGGLAVQGIGSTHAAMGDWVEAVGFPDLEGFLPILANAVIVPTQAVGRMVTAETVSASTLLTGLRHANYIAVTGQLLDRMQSPRRAQGSSPRTGDATLVLALQSPQGVFTAELDGEGVEPLLSHLEVGSTLKVSGICLTQTDAVGNPTSFKILLPSADNVKIVKPASFFTVKRLLILLCIALATLLSVTSLAYYFARRNTHLRAVVHERQAVAAERNRLARDLHDTLEQGLTGIQLHLQSIGATDDEAPPQTQECLRVVRSLVEQCHAETRQSIWDLRSVTPEHFDLGEALERAARSLVLGSSIRIVLRQQTDSVKIPPLIEDNLLCIGREALTNAVKHARPSLLQIDLAVSAARVKLAIIDDGCGLVEPQDRPGHFGLLGMHERVERINGQLSITNHPVAGCMVQVDVPLDSIDDPLEL